MPISISHLGRRQACPGKLIRAPLPPSCHPSLSAQGLTQPPKPWQTPCNCTRLRLLALRAAAAALSGWATEQTALPTASRKSRNLLSGKMHSAATLRLNWRLPTTTISSLSTNTQSAKKQSLLNAALGNPSTLKLDEFAAIQTASDPNLLSYSTITWSKM